MEFRGFEVEDDGALHVLRSGEKSAGERFERVFQPILIIPSPFLLYENREINNEEINRSAGNLLCRFPEKISRK